MEVGVGQGEGHPRLTWRDIPRSAFLSPSPWAMGAREGQLAVDR